MGIARAGIVVFLCIVWASMLRAQSKQEMWVDSVYNAMSTKERIGQLIMIRAFSKQGDPDVSKVKSLIQNHKVGGICFFQGSPTRQVQLINRYQSLSQTPLLTAIDGEWGLGMRFHDKAFSFPKNMTLGAIQDNNYVYEAGREIGLHCKRAGIHINFAPVVDVNNNPNNPVINDRSFGEDKYNVIAKSYAYMTGLQSAGVLACAKHFPGHGDTDVDSHLDLPIMNHSRERIDSLELAPFKAMIRQGIGSIMVAHLHIPSIDDRPNRPTTLSKTAVTDILRNELAFNGLIFTDAMEMKGVTKHFPPGISDAEAFLAGSDVILLPEDAVAAINSIDTYIKDGLVPYAQLEASVKRILRTKYALGLSRKSTIPTAGLSQYINRKEAQVLEEKLIENALTLVRDPDNLVPIKELSSTKVGVVSIGATPTSAFEKTLKKYIDSKNTHVNTKTNDASISKVVESMKERDVVIVPIHKMSKYGSKNFGITPSTRKLVDALSKTNKVIVVLFGSPYAVQYFDSASSVIVAYDDKKPYQEITAQALFGAIAFRGKLPVSPSPIIRSGTGVYRPSLGRLGFSIPERVGMSTEKLAVMDSLMEDMIKTRSSPGGQILVAKDNKIVFMKSYGKSTYGKTKKIDNDDVYDMASVTKICATTVSLMKLYDERKLDLDAPIVRYVPETASSDKAPLRVDAILAHQARLKPWIPFYKTTVTEKKRPPHPIDTIYARSYREPFTIPVTDKLFLRKDYRDTVWNRIYDSELRKKNTYRYSDLGLYLMARSIKNITGTEVDQYAYENFYKPLGLRRTRYNPLDAIEKDEIIPSEQDTYFRDQILQGHVHDMGAAMLGGVSGHAGLFSNAYEISIILQMLLNGGTYGGKRYVSPHAIQRFTTRYKDGKRRGLGFDMKNLNDRHTPNMSKKASESTYGHLGFTGIAAFADPENSLIFVMTANRTYPSMENRKYLKNNYRPKAQSIVYDALLPTVVTN